MSFFKSFFLIIIILTLAACNSDNNNSSSLNNSTPTINIQFNHGVASGDPLTNSVILWTRVTPEQDTEVTVSWEMAMEEEFVNIVASGDMTTNMDRDYTVKVDAGNLTENTYYYYRFMANGSTSVIGRTKTLAASTIDQVKFMVFSCANYPAGYFHVYKEKEQRFSDHAPLIMEYNFEIL